MAAGRSRQPSNLRCVIRVAAGPRLGFGHLMRARALARCLGMPVALSVRGGSTARRMATSVAPLAEGRDHLKGADLLIVDDPSLAHGRPWIARARRRGVYAVSIHDGSWAHAADLIVCASLGRRCPRTAARVLHGSQFYLLDRRIAAARAARPPARLADRPRVLVALGGGQHVRRLARPLGDALARQCPHADIRFAAGFSRGRRPRLPNGRWVTARGGLVQALAAADVAVVAGGVTLYEACALGVPAVGLAVVPAQRSAIRAFARRGALLDAGDLASSDRTVDRAAAAVSRLLTDTRLRTATAARARRLVDGRGAERVAAHIRRLLIQGGRSRG